MRDSSSSAGTLHGTLRDLHRWFAGPAAVLSVLCIGLPALVRGGICVAEPPGARKVPENPA